ncbi:AI-2E family transporter [Anaeromyxobacter terrae]|uniref:AI-2E family transporter n=1 Tax=Anaeromyxobacter terrae TaxID=2925406 RepID=UPI001F591CCA|nr:AI-2E family transporter [Anaeromyxobacter sp. SG22]
MAYRAPLWKRPRAQLFALTAVVWALVLAIFVIAWPVLLPFVLAALAAYVLDPLISRLARTRVAGRAVPRWAAVLVVYVALGALAYLAGVSILPQIYREAVRGLVELRDFLAGITPEKIQGWVRGMDAFLERYGIPVDLLPYEGPRQGGARFSVDLAAGIADALHDASEGMRGRVGDVVTFSRVLLAGTIQTLFFCILLFMLTAFISMDAPRIVRFFESLVPANLRDDFRRLLRGIDSGLSGVVRGQLTIMLVNGVLTLVGLLLIPVPFAFALGALATVLYVVPIFGTILSSVPIVLLALTAGGLSKAALALGWILVIHALEAYVLNPKIMGDASKIHPVLIVLALVIGERTWGLVGALLAVPVASVVVAIFRFLHRKLAELDARAAEARAVPAATPQDAALEAPRTKGSST